MQIPRGGDGWVRDLDRYPPGKLTVASSRFNTRAGQGFRAARAAPPLKE